MRTIDELLNYIVRTNFTVPFDKFSPKDKKILISLNKQIAEGPFLTEKQGNLLLRILSFYQNCFDNLQLELLQNPVWSTNFRILENTKNVRISDDKTKIVIEFSYDRDLKKKVLSALSTIKGNYEMHSPALIQLNLNEKNVLSVVDSLRYEKFAFSEDLLKIYNEIKTVISNKQEILESTVYYNQYFKDIISKELKEVSDFKILDRRIRHQYKFELNFTSKDLHFQIANRNATNVFLNNGTYTFDSLLESLQLLERLPVLVVLDNRNIEQCIDILKKIIDYQSIKNKSVYFRFDNTNDQNRLFNSLIQEHSLNKYLDQTTDIAVISNNMLPKFFIKSDWRPKSAISITNSFRNNKAHVFCNDVDLKIYYNNVAPMIGDLHEVV
jgi:hypothetical protein